MNILFNQIAEKSKFFIVNDPEGIILTIIAMAVVFISLILIYAFFHNFGKQFNRFSERKKLIKEGKHDEAYQIEISHSGELNAAIALALHLYHSQIHDMESFKLTINKVSRNYTPWSSKIYGLRQYNKENWNK
ncbi:MAG: OadG family protein [Bacteroidales bacterium]|nr:OadG family protein [Bacteroidales bacterium]